MSDLPMARFDIVPHLCATGRSGASMRPERLYVHLDFTNFVRYNDYFVSMYLGCCFQVVTNKIINITCQICKYYLQFCEYYCCTSEFIVYLQNASNGLRVY